MTTWLVKAGNEGVSADKFLTQSKVAVGWHSSEDFPTSGSWEDFRAEVKRRLPPEYNERRVGSAAGQLWSFVRSMVVGDFVITPAKTSRKVLIGRVTGDYEYDPAFDEGLPRTRDIKWFHPVEWDSIASDLRNAFTVWQTIVKPGKDFSQVIQAAQSANPPSTANPSVVATGPTPSDSGTEDLSERAEESIRQMLRDMDDVVFQKFVGAIFQAAGFTELFNSAGKGRDGGIDIILSKDPLGAGERIIVQVKHTGAPIGQTELQQLIGTLKHNEYGLMVSLSGINSNAQGYWRENRDRLLNPLEASDLIEILQEHYDELRDEQKALLPLKRVFVPVNLDEEG
jgi:restriction system protein